MKTADLEDADLDYWVARALGWHQHRWDDSDWDWRGPPTSDDEIGPLMADKNFTPSTDWWHGGPLIVERKVTVDWADQWWEAACDGRSGCGYAIGPTPLIAACRAIVASVYGDEVGQEREG